MPVTSSRTILLSRKRTAEKCKLYYIVFLRTVQVRIPKMMNLYESNRMQGDYVDEYLTELQVQQISSMLNTYQTL